MDTRAVEGYDRAALLLACRRFAIGRGGVALLALCLAVAQAAVASAAVPLTQVSSDPYTNPASQHRTEVEPDTFARGSTVVGTFQLGRFFDGGASNIGWATSTDSGATWSHGSLPGITKFGGGTFDRASDPSVAYDARHGAWIISSLALSNTPVVDGVAVLASRSTDGGLTWGTPRVVTSQSGVDKNWTVCDNTATSPFYGRCYTEWDNSSDGNRIEMSTSTDGGLTWGPALNTADNATGIGGQPVVKPNGVVVVPIDDANETAVRSFRSTDGGTSWGATVAVASISQHTVAAGVRASALPSAEIDGSGKVYVVWQDCRFRASCSANDIVMSTSAEGNTWSPVQRIPIDSTTSGADHFVPGLGVGRGSSGANARLGLTYMYYPNASCTASTCQLFVGYVSSANGGATWSAPTEIAGPMSGSSLPRTSQGRMFGDYISTSILAGKAFPLIPVAKPPAGSVFDQGMYSPAAGLPTAAAGVRTPATAAVAVPFAPPAPAPSPPPATAR